MDGKIRLSRQLEKVGDTELRRFWRTEMYSVETELGKLYGLTRDQVLDVLADQVEGRKSGTLRQRQSEQPAVTQTELDL